MAKFVAISGPSSSGKTSIVNELSLRLNLSNVIFVPDVFETVWNNLVSEGHFSEYEEINKDPEFLCIYIQRVIDHYKKSIEEYECTDKLVILDSSWVDISIYSIINMWYIHIIKTVQEDLLRQLSAYDKSIDKVYITLNDETKQEKVRYRSPFKRYNIKYNHPLELQYYELSSNLKHSEMLPSSNVTECATFIIEDLRNLGYLV